MAKFTPGIAIGAISGSQGGITFSRNAYGIYLRTRSIPVTSQTSFAIDARGYFTAASQSWRALTDAQRLAWKAWANGNPIIDNLGQSQTLAGNAAYVMLNARIIAKGDTEISDPPVAVAPPGLTALGGSFDIGIGSIELTFAADPVPANTTYEVWAAVVSSPGINYVRNLLKLTGDMAAAAASPFDFQSIVESRFGALQVDHKVVLQVRAYSELNGLVSGFRRVEGIIVETS